MAGVYSFNMTQFSARDLFVIATEMVSMAKMGGLAESTLQNVSLAFWGKAGAENGQKRAEREFVIAVGEISLISPELS